MNLLSTQILIQIHSFYYWFVCVYDWRGSRQHHGVLFNGEGRLAGHRGAAVLRFASRFGFGAAIGTVNCWSCVQFLLASE